MVSGDNLQLHESLVDVGDSLDSLSSHIISKASRPSSRNAIIAAFVAGIGSFTFGYCLGFTSPILTSMMTGKSDAVFTDAYIETFDHGKTVTISSDHASLFSSILPIGGMFGSMLGGFATDKYGRRGTIMLIALPFAMSWVWMAMTSDYFQLLVTRFLCGTFAGVMSMTVPMYIGETAPTHLRGSLGAVNQLLVAMGILGAYVVGIAVQFEQETNVKCNYNASGGDDTLNVLSLYGSDTTDLSCSDVVSGWKCAEAGHCKGVLPAWRWLAWSVAIMCFVLFLAMICLPETPPHLFKKGNFTAAKKSLVFFKQGDEEAAQIELDEMHQQVIEEKAAKMKQNKRSVSKSSSRKKPTSYYSVENHIAEDLSDDDSDLSDEASQHAQSSTSTFNALHDHFSNQHERNGSDTDIHIDNSINNNDDDDDNSASSRSNQNKEQSPPSMFEVLTAPDVSRPLFMGIMLMNFQQFSGVNTVIFYSGSILESAGMKDANMGGALVMAVQVAFTFISVLLMDKAGRKVLLGVSTCGMAVCSALLAIFFLNDKRPSWLALAALMGYMATFSLGLGCIPWLYMGEIFPAHARDSACSLVTLVNWMGSFVTTFFFSSLQTLIEPQGCFFLFAGICLLAFLFATMVLPETKGRTFHEIAADFRKASGLGDPLLSPIKQPSSSSYHWWFIRSLLFLPLYALYQLVMLPMVGVLGLVVSLVFVFLFLVTCIGPLYESRQRKADQSILSPGYILKTHQEMFLLEIPPNINSASCGQPYRVMVRMTTPPQEKGWSLLPPVIFPGGLGANLCFMARHQDELTANGFVVVNFDRLGVGFSDPYPENASVSPSALDVANELNFVIKHCEGLLELFGVKWISVGGSMGANVTNAFISLYPGKIGGFLNLDGLPHAFLTHSAKKFLEDGPKAMGFMSWISWTGLPRLMFSRVLGPSLAKGAESEAFTKDQIIGLLCRRSSFRATGLEYKTLMSCCDLEIAAWGKQATIHYNPETMLLMASLQPSKSIITNQTDSNVFRQETSERSPSELGLSYVNPYTSRKFQAMLSHFRRDLTLTCSEQVYTLNSACPFSPLQSLSTHSNSLHDGSLQKRKTSSSNGLNTSKDGGGSYHPIGHKVGGIDRIHQLGNIQQQQEAQYEIEVHPLAVEYSKLHVTSFIARSYVGLEHEYSQELRNHAAAQASLYKISAKKGEVYYFPQLTHMNLWQQSEEVTACVTRMASEIMQVEE